MDEEEGVEAAIAAAHRALSGRNRRAEARISFAPSIDARAAAWELAAMATVALASVLIVLGAWFL